MSIITDHGIYEVIDGRRLPQDKLMYPIGHLVDRSNGVTTVEAVNHRGLFMEMAGEDDDPFEHDPATDTWTFMPPEGTVTLRPLTLARYRGLIQALCPIQDEDVVISTDEELRAYWLKLMEGK